MNDIIKLMFVNIAILFIGFFGYLSWFLEHNTYALGWGITCSVVFILKAPFVIAFAIHQRRERKENDEKNLNQH